MNLLIHEKSCGAVVFIKKGEHTNYLLLNYSAGYWDFVKGNVEPKETEKETVIRELQEETAIVDAHFLDGFKETISYFYRRQGFTVRKTVVFFIIETHTEEVKISFEHIGYVWLDFKHAKEKLNFKNAKDVLQKAHDFLKKQKIVMD